MYGCTFMAKEIGGHGSDGERGNGGGKTENRLRK